jgi:hypothetical protein
LYLFDDEIALCICQPRVDWETDDLKGCLFSRREIAFFIPKRSKDLLFM